MPSELLGMGYEQQVQSLPSECLQYIEFYLAYVKLAFGFCFLSLKKDGDLGSLYLESILREDSLLKREISLKGPSSSSLFLPQ